MLNVSGGLQGVEIEAQQCSDSKKTYWRWQPSQRRPNKLIFHCFYWENVISTKNISICFVFLLPSRLALVAHVMSFLFFIFPISFRVIVGNARKTRLRQFAVGNGQGWTPHRVFSLWQLACECPYRGARLFRQSRTHLPPILV